MSDSLDDRVVTLRLGVNETYNLLQAIDMAEMNRNSTGGNLKNKYGCLMDTVEDQVDLSTFNSLPSR
ncbi:hypothetical protein [Halocatena halophila]|uniref:hypothetical protein n=1 Tax=Halocatena halophila TaxID=2814576 RepID=UPI002ED4238C